MNADTLTQNAPALGGLDQLRAIFQNPDRPPAGMGKTMGFDHVEIEEGRVVFGATPHEGVYNPIGTATSTLLVFER